MFSTELRYKLNIIRQIGKRMLVKGIDIAFFIASVSAIILMAYEYGYSPGNEAVRLLTSGYYIILRTFLFGNLLLIVLNPQKLWKEKGFWVEGIILILLLFVIATQDGHFPREGWLQEFDHVLSHIIMFLYSIIQLSKSIVSTLQRHLKPELMFAYSFLFIILIGTLLLLLPNAHHGQLRFIDAFFTSASAVCVTGLTTVDTSATFTITGQAILLLLIQIGGIGVMTFTSFIAMSFFSHTSFNDQMALKNILNEESMNNIFHTLFYTFFTTLAIEAVGTYLIWWEIRELPSSIIPNKVFFSLFHSVSAFCNAGFSTLPGNLYDPAVRNLYGFQGWIAALIILGGIGFPIVFNYGKLINHKIRNLFYQATGSSKRMPSHIRIVNTTTRIVMTTTVILLIGGTLCFWFFENDHILKDLSVKGQLATSFFGAVTPRTAGFNTFRLEQMLPQTIVLTMILMWIGASPMSTGGGIKTTTLTIAIKNIFSSVAGKPQTEIFKRQLSVANINRANAIILLSLLWIGGATTLIALLTPEGTITQILFEVISAISTVGLTLDFTHTLNDAGKIIISLTMFVGRVGLITILSGIFRQRNGQNYMYAEDHVIL